MKKGREYRKPFSFSCILPFFNESLSRMTLIKRCTLCFSQVLDNTRDFHKYQIDYTDLWLHADSDSISVPNGSMTVFILFFGKKQFLQKNEIYRKGNPYAKKLQKDIKLGAIMEEEES